MVVKIPADKVKELLNQIETVASVKKVTLKQLQFLCGLLAFCTKALHPYGKKRNPNNPVNRKEWDKDKKKGDATLLS
jgi:hypothetical protein